MMRSTTHDTPTELETGQALTLGGVQQWVFMRGASAQNPVLLFLHGGPGTPETPFLQRYNRNLEEDFVVVSWEQRGAGKSYSTDIPAESMHLEQFIQDTHDLTRWLQRHFSQEKVYLVGHSWGTLLGMHVVARYPNDYYGFVAVSQTSHTLLENQATFAWALETAQQRGNRRATRQLLQLQPRTGEPLELQDVSTLLRWVDDFGGAAFYGKKSFRRLAWDVLTTRVYTFWEKLHYLRGEQFSLETLYPQIQQTNLFEQVPEVTLPVVFVHGRHDYQVPMSVAREYYEFLRAPQKRFVVFEGAAHGVLYEDPDRFHALMREIVKEGF